MRNTIFTSFFILGLVTGCKTTEVNPHAYLADPTVQDLSKHLSQTEKDLLEIKKLFLEAQKKYLDARTTLSDTNDLRDTYFTLKDKLDNARKNHAYYTYKLKYEQLNAQERYIRALLKETEVKKVNR
jgi:hypothetical protein